MDGLFSKYAHPFSFIDGMISTLRFAEFVDAYLEMDDEKTKWEFYLHKVFDKSYSEWKDSLPKASKRISEKQLETTVSESKSILMNFIPN